MYNYSAAPILTIENVDQEIQILGVKVSAWPYCIFALSFLMPFNPILALIAPFIVGNIARVFFRLETQGHPFEFSPKVQKMSQRFPFLNNIFSDLPKLRKPKGAYRG